MGDPVLKLCPDIAPGDVPHLIEKPNWRRCAQHRGDRERWRNTQSKRRARGQEPTPYAPSRLSAKARRSAQREMRQHDALLVATHLPALVDLASRLATLAARLTEQVAAPGLTNAAAAEAQRSASRARRLHGGLVALLKDMGADPAAITVAGTVKSPRINEGEAP